jgi:CxxC motif-containing protein
MERRELTCIGCPMGCTLLVELADNGEIKVTGSSCRIGETYAVKECTNPTRIVTTTVWVKGGASPTVSVKTQRDVPKDKIFDCIKALKNLTVEAPVHIGDIIYENILDTKVNVVATRSIEKA